MTEPLTFQTRPGSSSETELWTSQKKNQVQSNTHRTLDGDLQIDLILPLIIDFTLSPKLLYITSLVLNIMPFKNLYSFNCTKRTLLPSFKAPIQLFLP